nr:glutathione S-transferase family protein [Novosphingobium flavum]
MALYGHLFSSYTWKALIPLYANETPFEFRSVGPDQPENTAFVQAAGPMGKFPVLQDGETVVFESSAIIDHLDAFHPGPNRFVPADPAAAIRTRMMDRVFDNYVMNMMQESVVAAIRNPGAPDPEVLARVNEKLERVYAWLENWLDTYDPPLGITLVECAAAPSLFYADWVHQIDRRFPRLARWRAHLLTLPAVSRCVEDARPFRAWFPLGAPDRD